MARTHFARIKLPSQVAIDKYRQEASARLREALARQAAQAIEPTSTPDGTVQPDARRLQREAEIQRLREKAAKLSPQARAFARKLVEIRLKRKAGLVKRNDPPEGTTPP